MVPVGIVRTAGIQRACQRAVRVASRSSSTAAVEDDQQAAAVASAAPPVSRNVSGLREWHYRKYHGQQPVIDAEQTAHLGRLRFQRKIWALYGAKTGISPAIGWPVKEEWEDKMEYESLASPDTLQEMIRKHQADKRAKEMAIQERMDAIDAKMENLEKWKKEILDKKRKKERELQAAKEKHDKLIEEVKEFLGFKVDSKDPRFKEVLEQKELEEKKRAKEAKKKEKQAKALAKLRQMTDEMMEKEKPAEAP